MKNTVKKSLSAVLAVLMLVSCFVFTASAEEGDKEVTQLKDRVAQFMVIQKLKGDFLGLHLMIAIQ